MHKPWNARAALKFALFGLVASLTFGACSGDSKTSEEDDNAAGNDDSNSDDSNSDDTSADDDAKDAGKKDATDAGKKSDAGGSTKDAGKPAASKDAGPAAAKDAAAPASPKDSGASETSSVPLTPKGPNCLQPGNGNYTAPGPYAVAQMDIDLGMIQDGQHTGKFTIYYPNPMDANCLHPIVAWGNGTGVTDSNFTYDFLNSNAASWGMVVAASSEDNTGSGAFHKAGLDYLLKQNADSTSMFYQKLSTRAGVSGHSQGGFGAALAASHPNVQAVVVEGASFVSTPTVAGLTLTGTMDIVPNAASTVGAAAGPMFVAVWDGGNHIGTETVLGFIGLDSTSGDAATSQKGAQQFQRLYAAWFRCFLADDDVACKLFSGGAPDNCGICKDPGWNTLASKNL
ncbi:MAG TPA: hypothetical protein VG963_00285 [Polyangiaceae bacterium]|nr:hypothetical protein [Polyangiaceae bacterium]